MELIGIIISAVGAGAAMIAAVVAIVTLGKSRKEQKEGLDRQKKQATLDAYNRLQEQAFDMLNQYQPTEIRNIAENNKSKEYAELGKYLARIEHFCVGLTNGIYDYGTFYSLSHGYFDKGGTMYNRLIPLLGKKLEGSSQDYFYNIHKVWDEMDKMGKNNS